MSQIIRRQRLSRASIGIWSIPQNLSWQSIRSFGASGIGLCWLCFDKDWSFSRAWSYVKGNHQPCRHKSSVSSNPARKCDWSRFGRTRISFNLHPSSESPTLVLATLLSTLTAEDDNSIPSSNSPLPVIFAA
jgi:hypothetical protein